MLPLFRSDLYEDRCLSFSASNMGSSSETIGQQIDGSFTSQFFFFLMRKLCM